jgi:hypothetical protein
VFGFVPVSKSGAMSSILLFFFFVWGGGLKLQPFATTIHIIVKKNIKINH